MNNKPAPIFLYLVFIVTVFLFGSSWMFNKIVLEEGVRPIWAATIRQSIGAIVFLLVFVIKKQKISIERHHIKLIIMHGVLMMALGHIFTFTGQQYISSGLSSIVFSFFPLAVVLISSVLMPKKEPLTAAKIIGTVIGFLGIIIIFYNKNILHTSNSSALGIIFILVAVFINAIPNVIIKRDGAKLDPLTLNAGGMLIGALLLLASAFIFEGTPVFTLTSKILFSELYLGIFCSALGFFLYFWLLRYVSVSKLSLSAYLTPIVAVILGYIFYNEILSFNHYIGVLLIFTGIFITEIKHYVKRKNTSL